MPKPTMTLVEDSANIEAHGYDPTSEKLRIQFKGGRSYDYENVTPEVYGAMLDAPSIGKYVAVVIKPGRPFTPVTEEEVSGESSSD